MYKIAYDESIRRLKDQVDQLLNLRNRVVSFLSFVGAATAFLVGTSIRPATDGHSTTLGPHFYSLCWAGTALLGSALLFTLVLLFPPFTRLVSTADARKIIERNINDEDDPIEGEAQLLHDLALFNSDDAVLNDRRLLVSKWMYFLAILAGTLQLAVWIVLVWTQVDPKM